MTTISALRDSPLAQLERLYREAPVGPVPSTRFRGEVLARLDTRFARSALAGALLVPFERLPFGIDFAARTWFFADPRARLGHFRVDRGRSRWRDTETLRLRYDVSRLPVRGLLYDEVKPLGDTLCLGLGGINRDGEGGPIFYFALEAIAPL